MVEKTKKVQKKKAKKLEGVFRKKKGKLLAQGNIINKPGVAPSSKTKPTSTSTSTTSSSKPSTKPTPAPAPKESKSQKKEDTKEDDGGFIKFSKFEDDKKGKKKIDAYAALKRVESKNARIESIKVKDEEKAKKIISIMEEKKK